MTTAKELMKFDTLERLRDVARLYKINGFSKLKKADLIDLLMRSDVDTEERVDMLTEKIKMI